MRGVFRTSGPPTVAWRQARPNSGGPARIHSTLRLTDYASAQVWIAQTGRRVQLVDENGYFRPSRCPKVAPGRDGVALLDAPSRRADVATASVVSLRTASRSR